MASDGLDILDLVAESIIVRDLEGRIQAWNRASEALYGVPRAAAVGRIEHDVLATEYPTSIDDIEKTVLTTGAWTGEVQRTSAKGVTLSILARWSLHRDREGKPTAIVETGRDVTTSKTFEETQAYAELAASERRYRDLFHYMPIGLTQVDASRIVPLFKELRAQGVTDLKEYIDAHPEFLLRAIEAMHVEVVNEHNVKIFGATSAAEMLGPVTRYFHAAMPTIRRSIEARYRGQEIFQEEMKATKMDGTVIDVLFTTARPGAIADKSLVGFIDITTAKKSEAALRQSEYRYRNMFQAMAAAFWELDFSGANSRRTEIRRHGPAAVLHRQSRVRAGDDATHARCRRERPNDRVVRTWRQGRAARQRRCLLARGEHSGLRRGVCPRRRARAQFLRRMPISTHRRPTVRWPVHGRVSTQGDGSRHDHGRRHRHHRTQAIGGGPARQRAALPEPVPGDGGLVLGGRLHWRRRFAAACAGVRRYRLQAILQGQSGLPSRDHEGYARHGRQ